MVRLFVFGLLTYAALISELSPAVVDRRYLMVFVSLTTTQVAPESTPPLHSLQAKLKLPSGF